MVVYTAGGPGLLADTRPLSKASLPAVQEVEVIAEKEANGPYSLKSTTPGAPVKPETNAVSLIEPPRTSVTLAPGVVVMLHVLNATGPAKSCSVALMSGEDRVCGNNVLTQPLKPRAFRSTPPSTNSLVETVLMLSAGIWPRHTQPPQAMLLSTPLDRGPLKAIWKADALGAKMY